MAVKTGNPATTKKQTESEAKGPQKPKGAGFALFLSVLSLLATVGVAGGAYYFYLTEYKSMVQSMQAADESLQQELAAQSVSVSDQLQQQIGEVGRINQGLISDQQSLRTTFTGIEEDLSVLRYKSNWGQREWTLAEVGYLLRMADDRLIYMRDVDTSKAALRTAIRRIEHLADPTLAGLEQQLHNDVQGLSLYSRPDPNTLLKPLEDLISGLRVFPFNQASEPGAEPAVQSESKGQTLVEEPESRVVTLFKAVKNELQSRVRVIHHDRDLNALDQNTVRKYQLEMANMRLEAMRMALLREDVSAFNRESLALENWAQVHLTDTQAVPIRKALQQLSSTDIFKPLPTLKGSWQTLQSLIGKGIPQVVETESTSGPAEKPAELNVEVMPSAVVDTLPAPVPPPTVAVPVTSTEVAVPAQMPAVDDATPLAPASQEQVVPIPEAVPAQDGKPEVL